ncbi:hypothetical protein ACGFJT_36785 [Actinomadura geliboluensis]|uniref:hypothetical protein n=1 Tax=Actinomadura geliboluensis TaxID=882440 RepID=UPI003716EEBE
MTTSPNPPVPPAGPGEGLYWIRCGNVVPGHPDQDVYISRYDDHADQDAALTAMGVTSRHHDDGFLQIHGHPITWGRDPARWNKHSNDLGDWCPWSTEPLPADHRDTRCPAGCRDSRPIVPGEDI